MQQNESTQLDTNITEYKIKVLLVDDQAIVGEQVRRMLQPEEDIEFHFCQEPSKAVQTAAELNPTVILQDLVMPDIDGLTLVKFFRAHPQLKDVPMIVLSSKEEAVTKADSFATGANDYLVKLPDRIELVARIRYHSKGYIHLLQRNEAEDKLRKSQKALLSELA
ncbi:MAG: response regulator, partial [Bacteroidota bacterium]